MTVYATRLVNGSDTRERMRRADALHVFPSGPGMARGGLRNDGGAVVTVNAGAMTVNVTAFTAWLDGGVSDLQGGYTFVSDTTEVLTVANGHASLARTDVVIAEVRDTSHDGSGFTDARVRILQGTAGGGVPALPTNALALRNITVPAGLSVGTGGLSAGNLSTDRRTYTTSHGGVLTVASQAERDALPTTPGSVVYRTDVGALEFRHASGWERFASTTPLRAEASLSANFVINNDAMTTIVFNTEAEDTAAAYDPATGVFTCPSAGLYRVDVSVAHEVSTGGRRGVFLQKNGVTYTPGGMSGAPTGVDHLYLSFSLDVKCAAGDTLRVQAVQTSGVAKWVMAGARFAVRKVVT